MGLIVTVVLGVLAVIGACASWLLADELKAWVPSVVERIISFAITRAPRHLRERLTEEWRSHVNDTPGHLGKLYIALGFIWASGKLRNEVEQAGIQESPLREPDAERPWAELLRAVDELRKDVPQYVGTDESAWPPYCSAARDGRHNVPQAALYFSTRYGSKTFHGPCLLCRRWIDTGEMPDWRRRRPFRHDRNEPTDLRLRKNASAQTPEI